MGWLDTLMDKLTSRGTKVVASGHAPADTEPETGSGRLSEELEADYGADSAAAEPPAATTPEPEPGPDEPAAP